MRKPAECTHGLWDMDTAVEDGMCPLCQAKRIEDISAELAQHSVALMNVAAQRDALLETLEWLDRKGGLGLDVHDRIRAEIDKATK